MNDPKRALHMKDINMKDSKNSTEQKRWEAATRSHAYHKYQLELLEKLRATPSSSRFTAWHHSTPSSSRFTTWHHEALEKLEKEFPTLKTSK